MARKRKRKQATANRLPTKGRLRDIADSLWSLAVKDDWGYKCAICGKNDQQIKIESHHIIPRDHYAHRYSLRNGIVLCYKHHNNDSKISAHLAGTAFSDWLEEHHPEIRQWEREHRNDIMSCTTTRSWFVDQILALKTYVNTYAFEEKCGVHLCTYMSNMEVADAS